MANDDLIFGENNMDIASQPGHLESSRPSILPHLEAGKNYSFDNILKAKMAAKELNRPENLIRDTLPDSIMEIQAQKIERNNLFAGWAAQSIENAAIAREQHEELAPVFDSMTNWNVARSKTPERDFWDRNAIGPVKSTMKTVGALPGVLIKSGYEILGFGAGAVDLTEKGTAELFRVTGLTHGERTKWFKRISEWSFRQAESLQKGYLESDILSLPEELQGPLLENLHLLGDFEYLFKKTGEAFNSLAAMLLGGAAISSAKGSALTATKIAPWIGGLMEASPMYGDLIADGVDNSRAVTGAALFGTITAGLNKLGLNRMLDTTANRGLLRGIRNFLLAGGAEATTEYAEEPAQALIEGLVKEESAAEITARIFESLKNVDVIPGSFLLGGGVRTVNTRLEALRAKEYADQAEGVQKAIDGTKLKQSSPEMTKELLENNGLTQNIYIPGDVALDLYQSDSRYRDAFRLTLEEVTEAAAMGQAVEVPLAQAMANLDGEQFNKVKAVMRETPEAPNLDEAQTEGHLSQDIERVVKKFQEQEAALESYNNELDRFKVEMQQAAQKTPGLATQIDDVGKVVELYDRFAARHFSDLGQRTDFLKRLSVTTRANTKPLLYQAAMYENKAETVWDFISEAESAAPDAKKSYYNLGAVNRAEDVFSGSELVLGSDQARHIRRNHPDFENWENILDTIGTGQVLLVNKNAVTGGDTYIFTHNYGEKTAVVVAAPVDASRRRKQPKRLVVLTAFEDTPARVENWLKDKNRSTFFQSAGGLPELNPHSTGMNPSDLEGGSKASISNKKLEVKKGFRPKGSVSIDANGEYIIKLMRQADLSTLIHETGHIFEAELRRLIEAELADEAAKADLASFDNWLSQLDDETALKREYNQRIKNQPGFGKNFDKLTAKQKAAVKEIAKREYFARAFEAYLREGQAPTPGLEAVFRRFKRWLMAIYQDARQLGLELDDEIRGIFDRMLITEAEIRQAAVDNEIFSLTEKELDALGVKGRERTYQAALMEAARRKAASKLQEDRDRDRGTRRKQWGREAREELLKDPVYQARGEIISKDGALDADLISELYGEEALKSLRQSVGPNAVKTGGQDPAIFAARYGFNDGAAMISAVTEVEGLGKSINKIINAREAEYDAQLKPGDYLLETEEAARQINLVGEYLARNLGREHIQQKEFARVASEHLDRVSMRRARQDGQYMSAMRRALRKERRAIGSGDFEAALEANIQANLNMEMARQARRIRELQESTVKNAKRFVGMVKGDPAARFLVNDIAARFGLMQYNTRLIDGKDSDTITSWLKDRDEDGFNLFIDDMVMSGQTPWAELTTAEFYNVADAIAQVITVERNQRQIFTAAGKASFKETVEKAAEVIKTKNKVKPVKTIEDPSIARQALEAIDASHRKIEALCYELDGEHLGTNWELIYKPLSDAENRRGLMFKDLAARLNGQEVFGAYTYKERNDLFIKKTFIPEVGESITKSQAIMTALNMGNEGNYSRLLEGRKWTDAHAQAVIKILDARDWKVVQAIWDTFGLYKDEAFDLQEKISGMRPTSVEPRPFTTAYGEMKGGYFRVIYDQRHAKIDIQEKTINSENPAFGMTRQGHLKERNAHGAGTPLSLDLSLVPSKLSDVITDLCFRRALIDVGRILKNREYRAAVEGTKGHAAYKAMTDWVKDAAKISHNAGTMDSIFRWARTGATAMSMGFKITTILAQPFGFTQSIDLLGYTNAMRGLNMAYGKGPHGTIEKIAWVKKVSPFMAQRLKTYDRDVTEATADFARKDLTPDSLISGLTTKIGLRRFEKWAKDNAFLPMGVIQYGVDLPTWLGAYQKGIKDFNNSEAKAIDYADSLVRLSQGSGRNIDLSKVQRGGEAIKMFTMFYSYFNTLYNLTALRVNDVNMNRDGASVIRAANSFLLLYVIPAILTEIAAGRGPDDDEEFLAWSAKQLMMYPLQTVVGGRTMAGVFEGGEFSYRGTPASSTPESLYNFAAAVNKAIFDEDYEADGKKMSKLGLLTLGYLGGLPLGQAEISVFNIIDYMDGTSEDYELRDLFFRRQKSRR